MNSATSNSHLPTPNSQPQSTNPSIQPSTHPSSGAPTHSLSDSPTPPPSTNPSIQPSINPSSTIPSATPWPDPVEGKALLNDLAETLRRFVVLPKWAPETLALWVLHTYAYESRDVSTYIGLESPEKRCGKTTLLSALNALVNRPVIAANISPPALFRVIEELHPTLLIDEADTFMQGNDELRGILNSGYTRTTAYVLRVASHHNRREQSRDRLSTVALAKVDEGAPHDVLQPDAPHHRRLTTDRGPSTLPSLKSEISNLKSPAVPDPQPLAPGTPCDIPPQSTQLTESTQLTPSPALDSFSRIRAEIAALNLREIQAVSPDPGPFIAPKSDEGGLVAPKSDEGGSTPYTRHMTPDTSLPETPSPVPPQLTQLTHSTHPASSHPPSNNPFIQQSAPSPGRLVRFSCWCPKIMAVIGKLPDTLEDRCIVIRMTRKTATDKCERLRNLHGADLRRRCARFAADNAQSIAQATPEIPPSLNDRAADVWEPLFALADLAGDPWPSLARDAATNLSSAAHTASPFASLLLDLSSVFVSSKADRMFSRDIVLYLTTLTDSPWVETLNGKKVTELWLAQQLRPYGLRPKGLRIADKRAKGYLKSDVIELCRLYVSTTDIQTFVEEN